MSKVSVHYVIKPSSCFARSDKQIFSHLLPRRFETVTYANVLFCRILTVKDDAGFRVLAKRPEGRLIKIFRKKHSSVTRFIILHRYKGELCYFIKKEGSGTVTRRTDLGYFGIKKRGSREPFILKDKNAWEENGIDLEDSFSHCWFPDRCQMSR